MSEEENKPPKESRVDKLKRHLGDGIFFLIFGVFYIIVGLSALAGILFALVVAFALLKSAWEIVVLLFNKISYTTIFADAQATATLIGVVITGLFGFGGIILTSILNANRDREQSKENEKLARDLQKDIAIGMDQRIKSFANAFEHYHTQLLETIKNK